MANTDTEDKDNGSNILLIVIISIVCINHLLVYKVFLEARKKTRFSSRAKHLIVILQAYGDICLALFPLALRLKGMMRNPPMMSIFCWKRVLAYTYLFHLLPFVHASGVIVLIAESFLFWRRGTENVQESMGQRWYSLKFQLVSVIPWILGLLLVLPLILAGFDFKTCSAEDYSLERIESFYWITIILPGSFALLCAFAYASIKAPLFSQSSNANTEDKTGNFTDQVFLSNFDPKQNIAYGCSKTLKVNQVGCKECGRPLQDEFLSEGPKVPERLTYWVNNNLASNTASEVSRSYTNMDDGDELLIGTEIYTPESLTIVDTTPVVKREKWTRLAAAILFCVFSMPCAIMDLTYILSQKDSLWPDSIQMETSMEILYRLHVLRSLISPLLWLNEYS
ncbi:hypothetical protein PoB_000892100 [Plakobranchus ocellatus]|uniref:G-protein coupled receptors family 1 profile domain-containing protein n=1 Tax=Plakobranchus ocellatus TaxID=259542 RepID=A0AAV3Y5B3_9GAST|nr:hypothetical protein PoB_000892100 [Plakobranchus ocellatus]